ncbi:lipopolysaccharide biosynthesis protein [Butyrivibrio sp. JL13D10]|uniref:lipopolysaccharide biosynthesis protein n=1 Tax=Butyrivibrio sp. JL13D10 TaxID=3236815 RepID=UPI0038B65D3F
MKIERTKNATRNMIAGIILKMQQILMPFVMRTAMIYFMGVQYLGLNSLFSSVLQVLNLAELGVGTAMVFSMYKPIAEDNHDEICALMKLYRSYYRIIGLVIALVGIILTPVIPRLIKGDIPSDLNIFTLYYMNLGATVLSYWLFAYKSALLQAHQRTDLGSKVAIVTSTIQSFLQFLTIWLIKNYYCYLAIAILIQVVNNICVSLIVNKYYPQYKAVGDLPQATISSINHRVKDLFTSKIGAIVVNSADTIVVSAFLGLTMLAIYQNYYFILTSVIGFISVGFSACTAGIGNSLIVESKEKNFNDLSKFTFLICWISGVCSTCFLNLYQPFMRLWVGNKLMLNYAAVVCFVIYFYIYEINSLLNLYKDAGGIWHKDRFRPLVTALSNLIMNLIMVNFWGIYGVLLSTVVSMIIVGMPWLFYNLFNTMFERRYFKGYVFGLIRYTCTSFIVCAISVGICNLVLFDDVITLGIRFIICVFVSNVAFLIAYRNTTELYECIELMSKITHGKINFTKIYKYVRKTV